MGRLVAADSNPVSPVRIGGPGATVAGEPRQGAVLLAAGNAGLLVHAPTATPVIVADAPSRPSLLTPAQTPKPAILAVGQRGAQGAQGIPGPVGGSSLQRAAGETLSALRAVYELDGQVLALDYRDDAHIDLLLGITLTAAQVDEPITVQRSGVIDDSGWAWVPGRVWLGADGALTQSPPADGYDVLVGAAASETSLVLNLQDPIELE